MNKSNNPHITTLCDEPDGPIINMSKFRKWALKNHPDKCPPERRQKCTEVFTKMKNAYDFISGMYNDNIPDNLCANFNKPAPKASTSKPAPPPKASTSQPDANKGTKKQGKQLKSCRDLSKATCYRRAKHQDPSKRCTYDYEKKECVNFESSMPQQEQTQKKRERKVKPCSELHKSTCRKRATHQDPTKRCKYDTVNNKCFNA